MPGFVGARRHSPHHGHQHTKARAAAFNLLSDWSPCARCGRAMYKWAVDRTGRSALHYDHADTNTHYLGFSHRSCNIKAGARKGARIAKNNRRYHPPRQVPPSW